MRKIIYFIILILMFNTVIACLPNCPEGTEITPEQWDTYTGERTAEMFEMLTERTSERFSQLLPKEQRNFMNAPERVISYPDIANRFYSNPENVGHNQQVDDSYFQQPGNLQENIESSNIYLNLRHSTSGVVYQIIGGISYNNITGLCHQDNPCLESIRIIQGTTRVWYDEEQNRFCFDPTICIEADGTILMNDNELRLPSDSIVDSDIGKIITLEDGTIIELDNNNNIIRLEGRAEGNIENSFGQIIEYINNNKELEINPDEFILSEDAIIKIKDLMIQGEFMILLDNGEVSSIEIRGRGGFTSNDADVQVLDNGHLRVIFDNDGKFKHINADLCNVRYKDKIISGSFNAELENGNFKEIELLSRNSFYKDEINKIDARMQGDNGRIIFSDGLSSEDIVDSNTMVITNDGNFKSLGKWLVDTPDSILLGLMDSTQIIRIVDGVEERLYIESDYNGEVAIVSKKIKIGNLYHPHEFIAGEDRIIYIINKEHDGYNAVPDLTSFQLIAEENKNPRTFVLVDRSLSITTPDNDFYLGFDKSITQRYDSNGNSINIIGPRTVHQYLGTDIKTLSSIAFDRIRNTEQDPRINYEILSRIYRLGPTNLNELDTSKHPIFTPFIEVNEEGLSTEFKTMLEYINSIPGAGLYSARFIADYLVEGFGYLEDDSFTRESLEFTRKEQVERIIQSSMNLLNTTFNSFENNNPIVNPNIRSDDIHALFLGFNTERDPNEVIFGLETYLSLSSINSDVTGNALDRLTHSHNKNNILRSLIYLENLDSDSRNEVSFSPRNVLLMQQLALNLAETGHSADSLAVSEQILDTISRRREEINSIITSGNTFYDENSPLVQELRSLEEFEEIHIENFNPSLRARLLESYKRSLLFNEQTMQDMLEARKGFTDRISEISATTSDEAGEAFFKLMTTGKAIQQILGSVGAKYENFDEGLELASAMTERNMELFNGFDMIDRMQKAGASPEQIFALINNELSQEERERIVYSMAVQTASTVRYQPAQGTREASERGFDDAEQRMADMYYQLAQQYGVGIDEDFIMAYPQDSYIAVDSQGRLITSADPIQNDEIIRLPRDGSSLRVGDATLLSQQDIIDTINMMRVNINSVKSLFNDPEYGDAVQALLGNTIVKSNELYAEQTFKDFSQIDIETQRRSQELALRAFGSERTANVLGYIDQGINPISVSLNALTGAAFGNYPMWGSLSGAKYGTAVTVGGMKIGGGTVGATIGVIENSLVDVITGTLIESFGGDITDPTTSTAVSLATSLSLSGSRAIRSAIFGGSMRSASSATDDIVTGFARNFLGDSGEVGTRVTGRQLLNIKQDMMEALARSGLTPEQMIDPSIMARTLKDAGFYTVDTAALGRIMQSIELDRAVSKVSVAELTANGIIKNQDGTISTAGKKIESLSELHEHVLKQERKLFLESQITRNSEGVYSNHNVKQAFNGKATYKISDVPDINIVGEDAYMGWWKKQVTLETQQYVEAHSNPLLKTYFSLEETTENVKQSLISRGIADSNGVMLDSSGRKIIDSYGNPVTIISARKDSLGKLAVKDPHKVEEKIFKDLIESENLWNSGKKGIFPRGTNVDEARRMVFNARPEIDFALRDIAGTRITVSSIDEQRSIAKLIDDTYSGSVIKTKDFHQKPKGDGYFAIHKVIVIDGAPVEVQIRTPLQTKWADWGHDGIYKGPYKNNDVVKQYSKRVGEVIHRFEQGLCPHPCRLPQIPSEIKGTKYDIWGNVLVVN
jgi:hypothetical protein